MLPHISGDDGFLAHRLCYRADDAVVRAGVIHVGHVEGKLALELIDTCEPRL